MCCSHFPFSFSAFVKVFLAKYLLAWQVELFVCPLLLFLTQTLTSFCRINQLSVHLGKLLLDQPTISTFWKTSFVLKFHCMWKISIVLEKITQRITRPCAGQDEIVGPGYSLGVHLGVFSTSLFAPPVLSSDRILLLNYNLCK